MLEAERLRAAGRGHLDHESQVLAQLAQLELAAGDWHKADEYARRALEMTLGWDYWNAETMGRYVSALVDAHLGRVDSARELAETGRRASEEWGDLIWVSRCDQVLGFLELSIGDASAAVVRLSPVLEPEPDPTSRTPLCCGSALISSMPWC